MKTNDRAYRAKLRREQRMRADSFKQGYAAGYEAGQRELRAKFRDLMGLEEQGTASRLTDSCIF